ncbi:MAG TPA: wax ester/triacylglycerol synthase domain-containing protein, partial [Mycobacteriales bacterium]|nr:wax ester/triacylglycerol synthase domain-containing protein [Mycobacteriales bacterium]
MTDDDAPEPAVGIDNGRQPRRGWPSPFTPFTKPTGAAVTTAWRLTRASVTSGRGLLAHPSRVGDVATTGWDAVAAVATLVLTPADARTSVTGETAATKRAVWSPPIPLDEVKAVGRATGATVNDVLLTVITGALGRYL